MSRNHREDLLEAAERLFRHFGYRKTTVADIARAAGMAKGSVYLHFSSKEEIFLAIVRAGVDVLAAHAEELLSGENSLRDRIFAALDYFIERTSQARLDFFSELSMSLNDEDLVVRTISLYRAIEPRLTAALESRLSDGGEPFPRVANPRFAAGLLVQSLFNLMVRLGPDPQFDYRRYLGSLVDTIVSERTG